MKKYLAAGAAVFALLGLAGCGESFTFEAVPVGVDDDDAESGIEGDPRQIECFTIEADSSSGDDGDQQLGTFCKRGGDDAVEQEDDD